MLLLLILGGLRDGACTVWCLAYSRHPFEPDTLHQGTGLLVQDASVPVTVEWLGGLYNDVCDGQLALMVPDTIGSAHTLISFTVDNQTAVPGSAEMGPLPEGTQLVLRYMYSDTSQLCAGAEVFARYTGQNRPGIDDYITSSYGRREHVFTLCTRVDSSNVECGISLDGQGDLGVNVMLRIGNVYMEGLERHKIPRVRFDQPGGAYDQPVTVSMLVPDSGLYDVYVGCDGLRDTTFPVISGQGPVIYYTTDGTRPDTGSSVYSTPLTLSSNTQLRATAYLPGAEDWYPSQLASADYQISPTATLSPKEGVVLRGECLESVRYYSLDGRILPKLHSDLRGVVLATYGRQATLTKTYR
jgi:hypothetical protein